MGLLAICSYSKIDLDLGFGLSLILFLLAEMNHGRSQICLVESQIIIKDS